MQQKKSEAAEMFRQAVASQASTLFEFEAADAGLSRLRN